MAEDPKKIRVPQQVNIRPPENPLPMNNPQEELDNFLKKALSMPPMKKKRPTKEEIDQQDDQKQYKTHISNKNED